MDKPSPDQNPLQYLSFHEVALQGGFRKAAETLGLSKSVVSARVKALESRLRVKLLQRSTRRVQLTQAGEALFLECGKLVRQLKGLDAVTQQGDSLSGRLKVSAPVDLSVLWLSQALLAFQSLHPDLHLALVATDEVLEFERHGIDLGLRVNAKSHRHLFQQKLGDVAFGVYCGAQTPLAQMDLAQRHAFIEEHGVVFLRQRAQTLTVKRRPLVLRPHRSFEVSDILCAKALLGSDLSAAVCLPAFTVATELSDGLVVDLLQGQAFGHVTYHFVSDRRSEDDLRVGALIHFLKGRWASGLA
jgi:DNA-binding transcriptional LysR family regulator